MKLRPLSFRFRSLFTFYTCVISCFYGHTQTMDLTIYNTSNTPVFSTNSFSAIGVGKEGYIWAGTLREGLYKFDGTTWEKAPVLTYHAINDIKADRNGGIWMAQSGGQAVSGNTNINGGLDYFPDASFSGSVHYGGTEGQSNAPLASRNARSVFIDTTRYSGPTLLPVVWSAHMSQLTGGTPSSGGISRGLFPTDPTFQIIRKGIDETYGVGAVQSLGGNDKVVWAFVPANYGRSQILEYDALTNNLNNTYDYTTVSPNVLSNNFQAKAIYIDKKERKWIGMLNGGLVVFDGSTWQTVNFPSLFQSSTFVNNNAITSDDDGNVYIGTSNGLIVYNGGPLDELTCFGSKAIVNRFIEQAIPVKGLIGIGGVARKSPFIMQMLADVVNMPIKINKSEQTSALGAAMFAATAAGIYNKVEDAMQAMGQGFDIEYHPDLEKVPIYIQRYKKYKEIGTFTEQMNTQ